MRPINYLSSWCEVVQLFISGYCCCFSAWWLHIHLKFQSAASNQQPPISCLQSAASKHREGGAKVGKCLYLQTGCSLGGYFNSLGMSEKNNLTFLFFFSSSLLPSEFSSNMTPPILIPTIHPLACRSDSFCKDQRLSSNHESEECRAISVLFGENH